MSDLKKTDFKKIFIIALPIISALLIYVLFFKEGNEPQAAEKTKNVLLIPDSEAENISKSKTEVYSQEKKDKRAKERENEESKISTSEFFNKLASEENEETPKELSEAEKEKRINELFATSSSPKASSSSSYKKKSWDVEDVDDPLSEYDIETKKKKKKPNSEAQAKAKVNEETVEPQIKNIPGKRSRNNSISKAPSSADGNLIPAVIHSDQTVKNGSTVKIRLLEDFYVEEQKIPKNTFVYGVTRFTNERVDIVISSIRQENNIISFTKSVFDRDGLKGLYFPENAGNEMSKEIGSDAIDEAYDIATSGAGAIGSVLSAGKSVLKRKNTERKVNLKANYKIYLK